MKILLWLAAVCLAWLFLAPTQLGGRDQYMITDGVSMLPTIHGGALVVIRSQPAYHVGEIAAYHDATLHGAVVLHRIIAIKDGRYTFKGDNNKYPDLGAPTKNAVIGAEWVYSPAIGRVWRDLRVPWVGAIFLGVLGVWAFADIGAARPHRHARHRHHRRATVN